MSHWTILELAVLYGLIPQDYKDALITPYVSIENDQVRFSIRVLETNPDLVRNELLIKIREGLTARIWARLGPSSTYGDVCPI